MNDLRVCLVVDNFYPNYDGVNNVIVNYHKYFLKHAKSLLVVPKIGKKKQSTLKNIHYVPSSKLFVRNYVKAYPNADRNLKKILTKFKPNIIHIHSPFALGSYFVKYAKKHRIPCLITFHTQYYLDFKSILHSTLISKIFLKYIVSVVNKCDFVFSVSKNLIKIMRMYGIHKKTYVLENGTDMKPLKKEKYYDNQINDKLHIPKNYFVCVFVGRIIKYKNLKLIIYTALHLSKKTNKFKFIICGDGTDLNWMKKIVANLRLTNFFIFTGKIMNRDLIVKIYARANLNLMLSLFDSAPLTIVEAASQNTPTICIKNSVGGGNIKNNINGYTTTNSAVSTANNIYKIIINKNTYKTVSKNAKNDLYKDWHNICSRVQSIYENILIKNKIYKY